uniref:Uncharacterized protein n=1 Tax=Globisporangium ultimum (strain ATCC 200006 / CBS 805.95 / DAOM BR144) TaxID=431595 RepID=K3X346_GLOUD
MWWGCYFARCHEPKFAASTSLARRLWVTWSTFFKIPSQATTYGSSMPIALYTNAHFVDVGGMLIICENIWSSLNGAVDVNVWAYVSVVSVQIRNIWYIALAVKFVVVIRVYCIPQRISSWRLSHGLFCIRGGMIGLLSSLTITAYLRIPGFRNTDVFAARCASFESLWIQRQFSLSEEGGTEFGFYFDLRMSTAVTLVLLSATIGLNALAALTCGSASQPLRRRMLALGGVICSKSTLIPYSTGNLASLMVMSLIWKMTVQHGPEDHPQELRLPSLLSPGPRMTGFKSGACEFGQGQYYDRSMPRRDEIQSGLVNIALLTELLILVKLYVVDQVLYLCQVKDQAKSMLDNDDAKNSQSFFLLPYDPMTLAQNTTVDGGLNSSIYELVKIVDFRTAPWRLMVLCG